MQLKKLKKQLRRRRKQVESFSVDAEQSIERNVLGRFERLRAVRRFTIGWVLLMLLLAGSLVAQFQQLSAYYQVDTPIDGGIYSEGMVGSISNVNPIYATSDVDRSLSRLLFAGLLGYDKDGQLKPQLAEGINVDATGRQYTLTLKPDLRWHDGQPLTSADVVFTFNTIKDPDAQSPLQAVWQNVTVTATDDRTVTFELPGALAAFPYSLTTGILPKHVLGNVAPASLRSNAFNTTKPVGTGPFVWRGIEVTGNRSDEVEEQVALTPFDGYSLGEPKLGEFIVRVYGSEQRMIEVFKSGQLTAVAGLASEPVGLADSTERHDLLLKAGTYVFFKNSNPVLSSVKVRQALVAASDPTSIINGLDYMTRPVTGPLLAGQLGYSRDTAQKTNDAARARQLLAEDGWQPGSNRTLQKNGQPLRFNLVVADTPEYRKVTAQLKKQWQAVGVQLDIRPQAIADYTTSLDNHDYDATLHGISIGEDPDVYAYWHGSQADVRSANRLNISEWKNTAADQALDAGRTRVDPQLRVVKYAPFLQAWQQEAPALGLYQPRSIYLTRGPLFGLTDNTITSNIDRYNGVENWQIRSARQTAR